MTGTSSANPGSLSLVAGLRRHDFLHPLGRGINFSGCHPRLGGLLSLLLLPRGGGFQH